MKRKRHDHRMGGFRFRYIDGDYDYSILKSLPYKFNKNNWNRALRFKSENEQDFAYREYDCTGSTQVRIQLKRKQNNTFVIYYREYLDV